MTADVHGAESSLVSSMLETRPTEQEVEAAYEAHRKTLPLNNGAQPWARAGWALQDHWRHYFRKS